MADTKLQQLVINVGTKAQIEAGIAGGTITENMLSVSTDGPDFLTTDNVIDNTTSTSTTDALSANMGKELSTQISNLKNIGRFCAIWDASTGVPTSEPLSTPYAYKTGDYFRIGVTGKRVPTGSEYVQGAYDTVAEDTGVGDVWYYDGTAWKKQASSGGGTVQDVQVNGTSVLSGGIANIQYATNTRYGVVKVDGANFGIGLRSTGIMEIKKADDTKIEAKTNEYFPIVPANLDKAVKTGITTNTITLTDTEQRNAQSWLGTTDMEIEFSDGSESTLSLVGKM